MIFFVLGITYLDENFWSDGILLLQIVQISWSSTYK